MEEQNFFEKFGLEVKSGEVEVGKIYPIYGMITRIINDQLGSVEVEINFNIQAKMNIEKQDALDKLKDRSFEPGIFVSTIIDNNECLVVECSTVIFGKKQSQEEM